MIVKLTQNSLSCRPSPGKNLSFIDIDSGHWPMISAPAELARLLTQAAEES